MSIFLFGQRRGKGEVLKHERMLVRVERIDPEQSASLPAEYNESSDIKTRLKRPWREYYVVVRAGSDDSKHIVLQIHKSRVHCLLLLTKANFSEFQRRRIHIRARHHDGKFGLTRLILVSVCSHLSTRQLQ